MAAYAGMLEDASPRFADCQHVEGAGSLLAVALVAGTGFFNAVQQVYRTIGPSFYGLRNTFMTLLLMAFLRIKNPEQMNYNLSAQARASARARPCSFSENNPQKAGTVGRSRTGSQPDEPAQ